MKRFPKIILTALTVFLFFLMPRLGGVKAQGPINPCADPDDYDAYRCCPENPEYPQSCPIDGGVVALLAAGVGYGIKRVRDSRRKNDQEEEGA